MIEFTDANVPINCTECNLLIEGIEPMLQHVLSTHPEYSPQEAQEYVRIWADSAYDEIDAQNAWRTEESRRTGNPDENQFHD